MGKRCKVRCGWGCWLVHDAGADADTVAVVSSAHRLAIPENSSKIIHAIVWHRSPSSSSYRSELGASSNSLSWTEKSETNKRHISDDYGGMKSGSHSQTLGRLYAWEKKLYEEVKLRNQDAKGAQLHCAEKTRTNDGELSVKNKTQPHQRHLEGRVGGRRRRRRRFKSVICLDVAGGESVQSKWQGHNGSSTCDILFPPVSTTTTTTSAMPVRVTWSASRVITMA
ncbi:uncharacterized protein [Triticum aestivum]|uniref:uncharacterized protein isoform X3 n=1 Tax=Triticum aestivum TaxID=4565 RepID=UPI001D00B553|nr:uncharacterized protein LOC123091645 isoform X3 [Triticum aestivum]